MQTRKWNKHTSRRPSPVRRSHAGPSHAGPLSVQQSDRRGSTLLVVMALLGLLALLGVVFVTFTALEKQNAEEYVEAGKNKTHSGIDPDTLFDWALEQLIVGPDESLGNSALWGRRHALLSNTYGQLSYDSGLGRPRGTPPDLHPYTGVGIHLGADASGDPFVDNDYDGVSDAGGAFMLDFNDSPVAHDGAIRPEMQVPPVGTALPDPDVDYTYPDINNLFLAYKGFSLDSNNAAQQVIIPSFHRPQYLRQGGSIPPTWFDDTTLTKRILRPHPEHVVAGADTSEPSETWHRFASGPVNTGLVQLSSGFPFNPGGNGGNMGVWTGTAGTFELDVDNDGDGINEGIYMDLDFPVQPHGEGQYMIPMFSYTVYDADALLNLNVHGNLARDLAVSQPFGNNSAISKSNFGVTPSEVNPQWGLRGDPGVAAPTGGTGRFDQHSIYFGGNPADWVEASNMEWFWLCVGRADFDPAATGPNKADIKELYAGRYGELSRLYQGIGATTRSNFPYAGVSVNVNSGPASQTNGDDNNDRNEGNQPPAFVHPIDYIGEGDLSNGDGKTLNLFAPSTLSFQNPSRWPQYTNYNNPGSIRWSLTFSGADSLMQLNGPPHASQLEDDDMESVFVAGTGIQDLGSGDEVEESDDPYTEEDLLFLQASTKDADTAAMFPRVQKVAPFNFNSAFNNEAEDTTNRLGIRTAFTTRSFDLKNFGIPQSATYRTWEWAGGTDFPPTFPGGGNDPFRPELRAFLEVSLDSQAAVSPQRKLSLNGVLQGMGTNADPFRFAKLRDHDNTITAVTASAAELNARLDRQEMARDIYVLLYTFCGGADFNASGTMVNYTASNAANGLYSADQLAEMAQFAVNVVDALDTDNVITRFEYDIDLSNGWDLDDVATTTGEPDRAEVFGVEAQQLTFSEVLSIRSQQILTEDHDATLFDDQTGNRDYLFIELRNASPQTVDLATSDSTTREKGIWRIVRDDVQNGTREAVESYITFRYDTAGGAFDTVTAGEVYTIATSDGQDQFTAGGTHRASDFRVDYDLDGTFDLVAPNVNEPSLPTTSTDPGVSGGDGDPESDLDLVHSSHEGKFILVDGTSDTAVNNSLIKGAFMTNWAPGGVDTKLLLQRRTNTQLPGLDETVENPWVTVDEITVPLSVFAIQAGDVETDITNGTGRLRALQSTERAQPFSHTTSGEALYPNPANPITPTPTSIEPYRLNSVGSYQAGTTGRNSNTPAGGFSQFQAHFDRDFFSLFELFNIPTFGPDRVTTHLSNAYHPPYQQFSFTQGVYEDTGVPDNNGGPGTVTRARPLSAAAMFLAPESIENVAVSDPLLKEQFRDNRWYRLLEFLEVPTRTHLHTQFNAEAFDDALVDAFPSNGLEFTGPIRMNRVPGKINLNMIRHPEVLAGLLDDDQVFRAYPNAMVGANQYLPAVDTSDVDASATVLRDWWVQYLRSRDRLDVATGRYLPGLPNSRPFRSLNFLEHLARDDGSGLPNENFNELIDQTVLRRLPMDLNDVDVGFTDPDPDTNRRLFEVGTRTEHQSGTIDPQLRYRLLSKVLNNTTTRSNVFVVFVSVDFFEAAKVTSGNNARAVVVGGRLTDIPGIRGMFVVDRSEASSAYDPQTQKFDFQKLVKHRLQIE